MAGKVDSLFQVLLFQGITDPRSGGWSLISIAAGASTAAGCASVSTILIHNLSEGTPPLVCQFLGATNVVALSGFFASAVPVLVSPLRTFANGVHCRTMGICIGCPQTKVLSIEPVKVRLWLGIHVPAQIGLISPRIIRRNAS